MRPQLTSHFTIRILARTACWLLLVGGIGLLASCSSQALLPANEAGLVGSWDWQQTNNGSPNALTPANTGHHMRIRFDRRGRARFYQDNMLVSAANFTVRRDGMRWWGPVRYIITYHGYQRRQIYSLTGNRLQLQDVISQPSIHLFQRTEQAVLTSTLQLAR